MTCAWDSAPLKAACHKTQLCSRALLNHYLPSLSCLPLPWPCQTLLLLLLLKLPASVTRPHFVLNPLFNHYPHSFLHHLDLRLIFSLQVHIRISSYQCGGVLLNHWYIATAAHCVHRAKLNKITVSFISTSSSAGRPHPLLSKVHLGEYDTKDGEEEPLDSQTYKVDHIVIHPDFRWGWWTK